MPTPVEILFDASSIEQVRAQVLGLIPIFDRVAAATKGTTTRAAKDRVSTEQAANKQIAADAARAEKDKTRAAADATREKERIAKDAQRAELNFIKAGQAAVTSAEKERTRTFQTESRRREQIAREEQDNIARRARAFGSAAGGAAGRVMGLAGRVAGIATAVGGGFAVADALQAGVEQEKVAGQLVRSSAERGGLETKDVQAAARAASIATAHTPTETLEGLDRFIRETGNLKVGVELLRDLARYAAASGVSMADLGSTAGQVFTHMHGDVGKTKEALLGLEGQARMGAIDIRNLAQYGGRLVGTAELFEGDVGSNIQTFGALTQIAKRFGGKIDAAEATEASARIFGEVSMHADTFKGMGVEVMGKGGKLRSVEDILLDTLVKTKGDITAIPSLFGRQAGGVEVGLAQKFLEGSGGKTDAASLAAGRAAAAASVAEFRGARVTEAGVDEDVRKRLAENDARLVVATNQFHAAINDRLLPLMPSLIDKFTSLLPAIQRFLDYMISDPWKGIGSIVALAFGAELAKAGLQGAITGAFTGIAEKFLKLFSTTTAATATVNAGVVNVMGGGGAAKVVEDIAKTGGGSALTAAGGGASVGLAGTAIGAGIIGLGTLIPLGFEALGERRQKQGEDALSSILGMPEDTEAQKRAKLDALGNAEHAGKAGNRFHELALRGQENDLRNFGGSNDERMLGMDRRNQGMGKHLDTVEANIQRLGDALNVTVNKMTAFNESVKPRDGGGRPDEPRPGVRNPEQ